MSPEVKYLQSNDPEIEQAVKQFQAQIFTGYTAIKFYRQTIPPKIIRFVMKRAGGAIKNEKQAEYFLLGIVIFSVLFSGYLFFKSFYHPAPSMLSESQILWLKEHNLKLQ